jgi:hypothetical protein
LDLKKNKSVETVLEKRGRWQFVLAGNWKFAQEESLKRGDGNKKENKFILPTRF